LEKEVSVIFWVFTIGSCLSSFFMVFVYRLPRHESLGGRSHCENCGQTLSPYQLIPIWSFFLLKGQCSRCAIPINPLYPVSELIGGILLVILYVFLGGGE
jgi:prepilin signal peptidase PulO-like enzyme (type II secretory pathway)